MSNIIIKLSRDNFDFRFNQYEGTFFHANINKDNEVIELKEFGNTHMKDNDMLYIPQIEAYLDLKTVK